MGTGTADRGRQPGPGQGARPLSGRDVGASELVLAAGLCASELVTNVLVHTRCTGCRLVVCYENNELWIEVQDDSPELPTRTSEPTEAEHGPGLQIVDAVASDWGVEAEPRSGKSVWVRLTVDPGGESVPGW